jgi:protocatechuate 3,4-dioxygenase beta subunit
MVLMVLLVLVVPSASLVAQTQAPPPAARDGVITGQVIDGVSGRPVSAAVVSIAGAGVAPARVVAGEPQGPPQILTGSDGRFVFRGLAPGSVTVHASKIGYAQGASGRRRPGGATQAVVLTAGQPSANVSVRVWKNGAIAGRVIDEAGEPVVGVQMRVLQRAVSSGRRQFSAAGNVSFTDDRGMYRFSNLVSGDYIVLASPPAVSMRATIFQDIGRTGRGAGELASAIVGMSPAGVQVGEAWMPLGRGVAVPPPVAGRLHIYPPTFHPSAQTPAQAAVVTLGSGEERSSADIQLMPVPTARVSGTLLSPAGPAEMVPIRLIPAGIQEMPAEGLAPTSVSDASGAFAFAGVVPGQYTLRATGTLRGSGNQLHWVELPISVAGDDIDSVAATLSPPLRISGRVQFEGNSPRPATAPGRPFVPVPFTLEPVETSTLGTGSIASTGADDGFSLYGYLPGRYRVRVSNSPKGWMFKGAMLNGVDVSETPFDLAKDISDLVLTFTDRWTGISGTVQGQAADAATVIAFTTDAQAWVNAGANPRRLRSARANMSGQFGISSLPPGDYYVVAIPEDDAADWRTPEVLESLARAATQITILDGEHKTIDVRIREVRR